MATKNATSKATKNGTKASKGHGKSKNGTKVNGKSVGKGSKAEVKTVAAFTLKSIDREKHAGGVKPVKKLAADTVSKLVQQTPGTLGRGGVRETWRGHAKTEIVRSLARHGHADRDAMLRLLGSLGMFMVPGVLGTNISHGKDKTHPKSEGAVIEQEVTGADFAELVKLYKQQVK